MLGRLIAAAAGLALALTPLQAGAGVPKAPRTGSFVLIQDGQLRLEPDFGMAAVPVDPSDPDCARKLTALLSQYGQEFIACQGFGAFKRRIAMRRLRKNLPTLVSLLQTYAASVTPRVDEKQAVLEARITIDPVRARANATGTVRIGISIVPGTNRIAIRVSDPSDQHPAAVFQSGPKGSAFDQFRQWVDGRYRKNAG